VAGVNDPDPMDECSQVQGAQISGCVAQRDSTADRQRADDQNRELRVVQWVANTAVVGSAAWAGCAPQDSNGWIVGSDAKQQ